jgi:hypothetical protein
MKKNNQRKSEIALNEISKGLYSGVEEKRQMVVNDSESFRKLWEEVFSIYHPMADLPVIDFEKNTLIAVFMGTTSTGGYSVEVIHITESSKEIFVKLKYSSPAPDDFVTMALSQPYHMVIIPKTAKEVVFEVVK